MLWNVMPLCKAQLTDVNSSDILNDGLYRRCNTYKGGGGYDKFPVIYEKRYGKLDGLNDQFVVQLKGCPLNCPYCYVTREGVSTGKCIQVTTEELIDAFNNSGCKVFHLMGGAPAIYIDNWYDIIENLPADKIFHSDIMLVEDLYNKDTIEKLAKLPNCLYAVSIKGCNRKEYYENTRTYINNTMFYKNLDLIIESKLPIYFTFTGMSEYSINSFKNKVIARYGDSSILDDSFAIELIHYNALDYK